MSERRIFNHPIRKETTLAFFPRKLTIEDFKETIVDSFDAYMENMKSLGSPAIDKKYIEEWVEQYLAWLEIEEER